MGYIVFRVAERRSDSQAIRVKGFFTGRSGAEIGFERVSGLAAPGTAIFGMTGVVLAGGGASTSGAVPSAAFHFASQAWRCARPTVPPFSRRVTFKTSS